MERAAPHSVMLALGVLLGLTGLGGGTALAAAGEGGVPAYPVQTAILVDGQPGDIRTYAINGAAYVCLADVGRAMDFNVYWDGEEQVVRVEGDRPYTGHGPEAGYDEICRDIAQRTNKLRTGAGLPELRTDPALTRAAQVRAEELAATTTYRHLRPDGRTFSTVTDCPYVGENLHRIALARVEGAGVTLGELAVEEWAASQGHWENMVNPDVDAIGVGVAQGVNGRGAAAWYCVQLFLVRGCAVTWVDEPVLN